ncbi:MAG: hypothetical protein PHI03_09880 [Bacteroidales bacterium]|nr:hypothetical protein [Bacteroidales bacterium]
MKQIIYIQLALLLAAPLKPMAQESTNKATNPNYRNVFWIHGLEGNAGSLITMSDYFEARYKINSYPLSYPSNRGIVFAANKINGFGFEEQEDDIVVAHSMGGLVSRQHQKQASTSKQFGGLITLGTPHQGAEFANSFDNGKLASFYNKTVTDGLTGYSNMGSKVGNLSQYHENLLDVFELHDSYMSFRENLTIVNLIENLTGLNFGTVGEMWDNTFFSILNSLGGDLLSAAAVNLLVDKIKEGVTASLEHTICLSASYIFGSQDEGYSNSKDDLKPSSSIISSLNNTPLECPKIVIAGQADYPAGIRFLGSTLSNMMQSNAGIGDITDNNFLNITEAISVDSRICAERYHTAYCNGSWWSLGLTNSRYATKRDAFNRQAAFWENGFEREYQNCLGSIYYTTETVTIEVYIWVSSGNNIIQEPSMPILDAPDPNAEPGNWQWVTQTYTYQVQHIHPNDGIVTLPSQLGLAGATTKTINQTNHEEMKKNKDVVRYLESQFNTHYYFKTPKK